MQKIALIGNPNCGKTTLFNILTGANQKVGNWPGVTVEKKLGFFNLADEAIELVDLPGIYSLEQEYKGVDEKIAFDYIENEDISLIINIIDGTNLERSLVLTQQLMEKTIPVIVVINMLDVAKQQGLSISSQTLSKQLNIPVIPLVASRKEGITELQSILKQVIANPSIGTTNTLTKNESDFEELLSMILDDSGSIDLADFNYDSMINIFDLLLLSDVIQNI